MVPSKAIIAILFFLTFLGGQELVAQCDTINLGNDTILCQGSALQLDAGAGFSSYVWQDGSTGQFLTVTEPGIYWCEVEDLDSTNLVGNGDFSSGNTGFYTDYVWGVGGPYGILSEEGTYVIDENAAFTHINFSPCVDHTTGSGLFMIVNGDSAQNENVWCQDILVEENTDYLFSGWFTSVHPSNPAILSYYINSIVIETVYLSSSTCIWQNFVKEWNSGSNTIATICIINQNTELGGNDFGIDDIHLLKYCPSSDTIIIEFEEASYVNLGNDTVLCEGQELILSAGSGYSNYLWSNGSVDSTITVSLPGVVWVQVTSENGCIGSDTLYVGVAPPVELNLGNDTTLCSGSEIELDAGTGFVSYLWSNNSTDPTITVSLPGIYWVLVTDENGCTGADTILVDLSTALNVTLGNDTSLCSGSSIVLEPGLGFESYIWQDGTTAASFTVNSGGIYWVQVTDEFGCVGSDTIQVSLNPSPTINLGMDTTLCTGESLILDPGSQFSTYLWQDNSTLPIFTVNTTGVYSVTVTNIYGCEASDEIFIEITGPVADLGADTSFCLGDTVILNPGQGYTNYLWQDNSTEPIYFATEGGIYSVEVTDANNCFAMDQIELTVFPLPVSDLGGDRGMCEGDSIMLEAPEGPFTYTWNGEPGFGEFWVYEEGNIELIVANQCGAATDMIHIETNPMPYINLGQDQLLEPGAVIELDAGEGYDTYTWQDGSTGQFYVVEAGQIDPLNPIYSVEVSNGGCINSDTIKIVLFSIKIPNVFTPNGDGENDTFTPMTSGWNGVNKHQMSIYNRWGEKVWESNDFESGWDGKRNGTDVSPGTYFWILEVLYGPEDLSQTLRGTVTLLID